jgi:4-amino-4-deoxy-L-arabinose transferase-like glycosyltransferase
MRRWAFALIALAVVAPMALLALYPPTGFDETMYHLPLVRDLGERGLAFHADLRFPVFPLLAELLAVPMYALGGDVATHAIPLLATLLTAALLLEWGRYRRIRTGPVAAAAFLGTPIVVHLATSLYIEAVLTLFVTAGFYCLDRAAPDHARRWLLAAGLAFGAAAATKYLGLYFAMAGAAIVLVRRAPLRRLAFYGAGLMAIALPMYAWIYGQTRNPVFPFFGTSAWAMALPPFVRPLERLVGLVRIPWDVVFARGRMNWQPPFTPLFALALAVMPWSKRGRWIVPAMVLGYLCIFTFLPQDPRYLVPLLPLLFLEAASALDRPALPRPVLIALVVLVTLPGPAYALYRIARQGPIPRTPAQRTAYLERVVPEYRALERASSSRVYTCGCEQLKWYAAGPLLGDHVGPYSYTRILGDRHDLTRIHTNLAALRIETLLVPKRTCDLPLPAPGFTLLYEDEAAQLWRVDD